VKALLLSDNVEKVMLYILSRKDVNNYEHISRSYSVNEEMTFARFWLLIKFIVA